MKATVTTIITQRLSYDRCDEFVKVKTFDESEPISKIKDWVEYLKTQQAQGTGISNVCIEFEV